MRKVIWIGVVVGFMLIQGLMGDEKRKIKEYFELSMEELLNIEISTAGRIQEKIGDIPASVEVITRKEIESLGYTSLREILNSITGYYAMSNLGIDIYGVRGFAKGKGTKGNNFIVMINNMKITDNKILTFYQIPVQAIDRIEVVRGPMSVIYGDNAFFGAINILTNEKLYDESAHLAAVSYGSMNTREMFGRLSGFYDNLQLSINVSRFDTDGMDVELGKMISRPERMDEPLFGGAEGRGLNLPGYAKRTKSFLEKDQTFVNVSARFSHFYFDLNHVEANNGWYYYYPSLDTGTYVENRSTTLTLGYKGNLGRRFSTDARLRYTRLYANYTYNHLFEGFYGWDTIHFNELDGEFNLFWNPTRKVKVTLGLEYENMLKYVNDTNVPLAGMVNFSFYYIDPDDHGEIWSSYLQSDFSLTRRLKIIAGVRISQMMPYRLKILMYQGMPAPSPDYETEIADTKERGKLAIMPRLALVYHLNKNNIIKFFYGKAIKRPSYHVFGEDMRDIHAGEKNEYSEAEYIHTYEINFISSITPTLGLNLSLFRNTLDNMIIERSGLVDNILRAWYENLGQIRTMGLEATLFYKPTQKLHVELSGVYQRTRDRVLDIEASYSPRFLGYLKFIYRFTGGYTLAVTGNYVDKMNPFYNPTPIFDGAGQPTGEYMGRSSFDVDSHLLLNLNFRIEPFLRPGLFVNFHLKNLFDTEAYYPTFSINNAWADRGTLVEGRSIMVTLGWKF